MSRPVEVRRKKPTLSAAWDTLEKQPPRRVAAKDRLRFQTHFLYLGLFPCQLQVATCYVSWAQTSCELDRSTKGRTMNSAGSRRVRQLASDTYAGICPEALQAIAEANQGHASPYGDDVWTARATELLCDLFETDCSVFFVGTGTAANALALAAVCQPYHSVLCHADAHVQTDECGAPEYAGRGLKLVPIPGD